MIDTLKKMILPAIVAVVVTLIVLVGNQPANIGSAGDIETFPVWFAKGLYGGATKVQIVDSSGNLVAPITGSTGTFSSTLGVTGTTTLSNGLNLNKVNLGCVSFFATSSATRLHMQFEATSATSTFAGGIEASFGACNN